MLGNQYTRFGTSNMVLPPEGPRVIPFRFNFSSNGVELEDLLIPIQNGFIDNIQTMFIDNAANNTALTVQVGNSGQTIVCPPRAQGYFTILFNDQDSKFTFNTTPAANLIVSVFVANVPIMPAVWKVT